MCIYIHKVLSSLVPNFSISIYFKADTSRGQLLHVPNVKGTYSSTVMLKEGVFGIEGLRLFNSLPKIVRNFVGPTDRFKLLLDLYLDSILDQPNGKNHVYAGSTNWLGKLSISIKDWRKTLHSDNWMLTKGTFLFKKNESSSNDYMLLD